MGMLKNLRQKLGRRVGAMVGGFEGGLSARRLKTFAASRAHVNTLIQAAGASSTRSPTPPASALKSSPSAAPSAPT